ncbi:MAG: hypothetical protein PHV68_05700 [Candidatus Gastranaerophilales bacterium]|nr:hypothetical protein [Candidatus Gastranaerophilales bacterium]
MIFQANLGQFNPDKHRKNATKDRQEKNLIATKEGVLVDNFIKEDIDNAFDTGFIIPQNTSMPKELTETPIYQKKKLLDNPLVPLCLGTLGVLGSVAVFSKIIHNTAKHQLKLPTWKSLPELPRNMNLNDENHFVTYVAIQNPSLKNTIGAFAMFGFAGATFIMKSFVDGFKEIWVKKQDAKIQENLQENLIDVETKCFSGKHQIINNMLNQKTKEFKALMCTKQEQNCFPPSVFKGFTAFKGSKKQNKEENNTKNNLLYLGVGVSTLVLSTVLTGKIFKNLRNTANEFQKYHNGLHDTVKEILKKSPEKVLQEEKETVKQIFQTLNFKSDFAQKELEKAGYKKEDIEPITDVLKRKEAIFVSPPEALGGKQGIQYYTYIDDVRGHFYNWIMNKDNKLLRNLFLALASVSGVGYLGKTAVEAQKEFQVNKVNAQTELQLQKNLVNVELKNFLAKKNSAINPLMDDFRQKVNKGKNTNTLHQNATEILNEIKNGAPFIYA